MYEYKHTSISINKYVMCNSTCFGSNSRLTLMLSVGKGVGGSGGDAAERPGAKCDANAVCSFKGKLANQRRGNLVDQWRKVSKPRRQGAIPAMPRGSRVDFAPLFDQWLEVRNLGDVLERMEDQRGWYLYKYVHNPVVRAQDGWEVAYHGTWWYSVWGVLESGVLLESNDKSLGHDFWEPGVYCTPELQTARWYARPHVLFADGVYHRILFELRVDSARRKKYRKRGGVQWVFPSNVVALHAVWI